MQIQLQNIELYCPYSACFSGQYYSCDTIEHVPFVTLWPILFVILIMLYLLEYFFRTISKSGAYGTGSSCSSLLLWTSFYDGSSATIYLIYCASIFNRFQQSGTAVSLNIKVQFKASYCHCLVCLVSTRLVRSMLGKEISMALWPCPSFGVPVLLKKFLYLLRSGHKSANVG